MIPSLNPANRTVAAGAIRSNNFRTIRLTWHGQPIDWEYTVPIPSRYYPDWTCEGPYHGPAGTICMNWLSAGIFDAHPGTMGLELVSKLPSLRWNTDTMLHVEQDISNPKDLAPEDINTPCQSCPDYRDEKGPEGVGTGDYDAKY